MMAGAKELVTVSYLASGNLSALQYHFVYLATDEQVTQATASTVIDGILQDDPDAENEGALVGIEGISKLVVDGNSVNIAVGDKLAANSSGHGVKTATNLDDYGAVAMNASTADGDIIQVRLMPGGQISAT